MTYHFNISYLVLVLEVCIPQRKSLATGLISEPQKQISLKFKPSQG